MVNISKTVDEFQGQGKENPKPRTISSEHLQQILEAHQKWVNTNGNEGFQANLSGADLRKANFADANLEQAILYDANLQDADLANTTGLLTEQLSGANVAGAKLPEAIKKFESIAAVDEASRIASRLFVSMLLGCLYAWLTIGMTTDTQLITNSGSSPLPLLGTKIPIVGFYLVAPLILLCLYIYFHLYLQRLWEGLAQLPAVFPDGRPLDKCVYPWLMNGLVRRYFIRLRENKVHLFTLQTILSIFLAWWLVPMTFILFWLRFFSRRQWEITFLHILILVISILLGIRFLTIAIETLRRRTPKIFFLSEIAPSGSKFLSVITIVELLHGRAPRKSRLHKAPGKVIRLLIIFTFLFIVAFLPFFFFFIITLGIGDGIRADHYEFFSQQNFIYEFNRRSYNGNIRRVIPWFFNLIGLTPYPDLYEARISISPPNWKGIKKDDLLLVEGVRLQGQDLGFASASRSFWVNANLESVNLDGANLYRANLQGANLNSASLWRTFLEDVNMQWANLAEANFVEANLKGARLDSTIVYLTDFAGANLQEVSFLGARGLDKEMLAKARNWILAYYSEKELSMLGLSSNHNDQIRNSILTKVDLQGIDLRGADFQFYNLEGANLKNSDLRKASFYYTNLSAVNLQGANIQDASFENIEGFNKSVICSARNWFLAYYDKELLDSLRLPSNHNEKLRKKILTVANLQNVDLSNAKFSEVNLQGVNLSGANLSNADLSSANLTEVDLQNTNLYGADLRNAKLLRIKNWKSISNMTLANISGVQEAPEGFVDWATESMGAVSIAPLVLAFPYPRSGDEKWQELKEKARTKSIQDSTVTRGKSSK